MDEKQLIKEIVKTRNAIRKKYKAIKTGRLETELHLEKTFKPITEPLHELVTKVKNEPLDMIKAELKEEDKDVTITPPRRKYLKMEPTSTPKSSIMYGSAEEEEEQEDFATPTQSSILMRTASLDDIPSSGLIADYLRLYIDKSTKIDKAYGVYFDNKEWKIGNSNLIIDGDNIAIKDKSYKATSGLLDLLFLKKPTRKNYTAEDLRNYSAIMRDTNFHRRNFEDDGQIKGSGSDKYTKIIKKLAHPEGQGLMMQIPKENIDYTYWDDPNELVDRLRLLIASQLAGNNNHNNEIVAIIEELREAGIIV